MRNPFIDAVRAIAVVTVVLGHWLVTALVDTPTGMYIDSPLKHLAELTPVSWVLQTLGLFFFVGGYAAAHSQTLFFVRLKQLAVPTFLTTGRQRRICRREMEASDRLAVRAIDRNQGSMRVERDVQLRKALGS